MDEHKKCDLLLSGNGHYTHVRIDVIYTKGSAQRSRGYYMQANLIRKYQIDGCNMVQFCPVTQKTVKLYTVSRKSASSRHYAEQLAMHFMHDMLWWCEENYHAVYPFNVFDLLIDAKGDYDRFVDLVEKNSD